MFFWQGGEAQNLNGVVIELNGRVLAPKWFWKAVCDPVAKQSIFFRGENTITDVADDQRQVKGCFNIKQHKRDGVIQCFSLQDAKSMFKSDFQIPDFHEKNCVPSIIGAGFKPVLANFLV